MLGSIIDKEAPALPTESCFTPWLGAFLAMCLDKKPEMRPAARDLLKHEWLKPRAPALGASDAGGSHGGSPFWWESRGPKEAGLVWRWCCSLSHSQEAMQEARRHPRRRPLPRWRRRSLVAHG